MNDGGPERPVPTGFGLLASLKYAINGVLRTLVSQRNLKVHWVAGLCVMLVGMALPLELASRASLIICVLLVVAMEILNSAFEAFVDLHIRQYEHAAMVAKDAAAAAVLVFATGALIIFLDVLIFNWSIVAASSEAVFRTVLVGVPIVVMLIAILWSSKTFAVVALGAVASALLAFLAYHSRDIVFSLGALTFILGACVAQIRKDALLAP